jgi:inosine-uridine nucleoside N-ribohydrolase
MTQTNVAPAFVWRRDDSVAARLIAFAVGLITAMLVVAAFTALGGCAEAPMFDGGSPAGGGPGIAGIPGRDGAGTPVIADLGGSPDSHLGLLLLLSAEGSDVRAVTTVAGAADPQRSAVAARRLLRLTESYGVPVAVGAASTPSPFPAGQTVRDNDIDRHPLLVNVRRGDPAALSADQLITATLRDAGRPTVIVAMGPATNVAAALSAAPDVLGRVKAVYLAAGDSANFPAAPAAAPADPDDFRNTSEAPKPAAAAPQASTAEDANLAADRAAADALSALPVPVYIVPTAVARKLRMDAALFAQIEQSYRTPAGQAAGAVTARYRESAEAGKAPSAADAAAALAALRPDLFTWEQAGGTGDKAGTVRIATDVDAARVRKAIAEILRRQPLPPESRTTR